MSFDALIESLIEDKSDFGVMAIENSIAGSIIPNYSLIDKYGLSIIGEHYININHNLMVYPGVKFNDVNLFLLTSWFVAMQRFIKNSKKTIVEDRDTADVAKRIIENKIIDTAAIASFQASELYGLEIIERNIQTIKDNETRFVIISKKSNNGDKLDLNKASLKFILSHENGSLAQILNILANHNQNLTKIQSIPIIETPWKYSFFVDLTFKDYNNYKKAIDEVTKSSELVKEFGVYLNFKSK